MTAPTAKLLRRAIIAGVLAVVAWGALVAFTLLDARAQAADGRDALASLRASIETPSDVLDESFDAELARVRDRFASVDGRLEATFMAPAHHLPLVGRQLESASAISGATETALDILLDARRRALAASEAPGTGRDRVAVLLELEAVVSDSRAALARIDLGPSDHLVDQLADARRELRTELTELERSMGDAQAVLETLAGLLAGPRRYLVLAANNSEMRAGSGMFLSAGELEFSGGSLSLTQFRTVTDIEVPAGTVEVTGDLADRWGWLHPEREWRNLMASPRFPASAALGADMWRASTGRQVSGVIAIDPVALSDLLTAVGPVEVDGERIAADRVDDLLLHDQYQEFDELEERPERRDRLADIASAVLDAMDTRSVDLVALGDALRDAVRGRHLLVWSRDDAVRRTLATARVDGTLGPDSLFVSVLNRGGNKLDRFLRVRAGLEAEPAGEGHAMTVRLTLRNTTDPDEPRYVQGPGPGFGLEAGTYRGIVAVNVPGASRDVSIDGLDTYAAAGADGPTVVVAHQVEIPRGDELQLTVRFTLPAGTDRVRIGSSAREPGIRWVFGVQRWTDHAARVVEVDGAG